MQQWDIPADANAKQGGLPANPKATKFGMPIDMGDALRQLSVAEEGLTFLLILGFGDQHGDRKKWIQGLTPVVTPGPYRGRWAPITRADLEKLDAIVKDKSLSLDEARAQAQAIKRKAIMQVNPKLDAKQRRLQCSIRFGDLLHFLAPTTEPLRQDKPTSWSVALSEASKSPPRRKSKS